ncbi:hypothetical protein RGQ29_020169 [Quercus rubra]|uniref:Flavonol synthase n=1 Tax=Quercus rubra TaxID=3512 RepID=A0AAN7FEC8_QUERU|nr:hypothetical protein RGQ29_020169 [Quercus rubra]
MHIKRGQATLLFICVKLPVQFILPAHERPENTVAVDGVTVPVISLSQPHDVVVKEVAEACQEWGFFLITDHGISPSLIQRLKEVGQEFFELPQEEKEAYANEAASGKFEGYGGWIDYYFHVMASAFKVNYDVWPKNPPAYRGVTEEYSKEILRITENLLQLLSEGLGLEGKVLKSCLGVEPHTDMSALTILVPNDVPGLQVWKDDNWVAVNLLENAIFVHVGDQIEVLSNGKYKMFIAPPHEANIGSLSELVNDQNQAKYSTKTYAEYRHRKLNKLPQR